MKYNELTHEEKIHIEGIYSVVTELLASRNEEMNLDKNNIAKIENNKLIICNILASMMKYDSILKKLNITIEPYSDNGLYIVKCDDENTYKHIISDVMRYI